ncbi:MAG: MmcQ/YjbR family DNA-binding protein [Alphaproteobacteria bacterium]|nr:MmcQ/YjbR family DNA-binding protein [Alphaproteobacteria bacterium]
MTVGEFRKLALSFAAAEKRSHMGHPDFRVEGKIFATLAPKTKAGVVKLTRDQQEMLCAAEPKMFRPVNGAWGLKGWTMVALPATDKITAKSALTMAWKNTAPKSLLKTVGV